MLGLEQTLAGHLDARPGRAAFVFGPPTPGVAKPQRRQQVQPRRLGAAVGHGDADQDVVRPGLGVFGQHVEVAVAVEDAGVDQFELRLVPAPAAVLLDEPGVRELGLRILVERLQVGMRGRGVEVEVALLHVLAVVALRTGEAEEALLEDRVLPVPQRQGEAEPALAVGDAEQAVLAPAIGAAAGVVVREVIPGRAVRRIILAHGAPLALGEIGAPAFPVLFPRGVLRQAPDLSIHG